MAQLGQSRDLSSLNTLALNCVARNYHEVGNREDLERFCDTLPKNAPLLVLGGGSNLILPEVVDIPVLKLTNSQLSFCEQSDDRQREFVEVRVGAALDWDGFVAECVARDLGGIENLSLIPGSVGAAPVQNIGAYGVELVDVLKQVDAFDRELGKFVSLVPEQCAFAYRHSIFKQHPGRFIIYEVVMVLSRNAALKLDYGELKSLQKSEHLSFQKVRDHVIKVRQAKLPDPVTIPNVGSFFKNPIVCPEAYQALKTQYPELVAYEQTNGSYKLAAGWLIDQAGWKGKVASSGKVAVHDRQALVLVNRGGAGQRDVLSLAAEIKESIAAIYGVELEIEPVRVD